MSFLPAPGVSAAIERQSAVVQDVITGDTVRLDGGKLLKYAGISSPPPQSKILLVQKYGAEALAFNRSLVGGKRVQIEWGQQIRNDEGHLLGYVFLDDGRMANLELLKAGHAKAAVLPPNLNYAAEFRRSDLDARRQKLGLWKEEPENPYIKDEYIGDKNTKIFYFPTSPELERIPESYLVRFRSRIEATAAGYRSCAECKESRRQLY